MMLCLRMCFINLYNGEFYVLGGVIDRVRGILLKCVIDPANIINSYNAVPTYNNEYVSLLEIIMFLYSTRAYELNKNPFSIY